MLDVWADFCKTIQALLVLIEDQEGGKGEKKAAKELVGNWKFYLGKV